MSKFVFKAIAAAALAVTGASSFAQVNISANPVVPVTYAREAVGATITLRDTAAGDLGLRTAIRWNFSPSEVRGVRLELSGGATFPNDPGVTVTVRDGANNIVANVAGNVNGLGTSVLVFTLTSPAAPAASIGADWTITIAGPRVVPGTAATIQATYSLFDTPGNAVNATQAGRLTGVGPANYIQFANSVSLTSASRTETASVNATPAFTNFGAGPRLFADLATINFNVAAPAPLSVANPALPITLPDLLANTTTLSVTGDFSQAANADGTFTGAALNRVFLTADAACSLAAAVTLPSATLSATTATFTVGNVPFPGARRLCYLPRLNAGGTATIAPIPVSTYTVSLNPVTVNAALYAVTPITNLASGSIVRDGTELQAPLFQTTPGYVSRFVLTNTGTVDANYTIVVRGESGAVLGTANLTGTIPAGTMRVFDSNTILTSVTGGVGNGAPRAFAVVSVDRPSTQIQGMYQTVNIATGAVSQTPLLRPGTN